MSRAVLKYSDIFCKILYAGVQRGDEDEHPADDSDHIRCQKPRLTGKDKYAESYHGNAGLYLA